MYVKQSLSFNNPDLIKDRLLNKRIIKSNGCWEYRGWNTKEAYPLIYISGRSYGCHRISALIWNGFDIKSKLVIRHGCDNRNCYNPKHLSSGTYKDNEMDKVMRMRNARRFNQEQIREIREMYVNGYSWRKIAKMFNVSHTTIGKIVKSLRYFHPPYADKTSSTIRVKSLG